MSLLILGIFGVILEVFILEVPFLKVLDLEVLVIVHTREDVDNDVGNNVRHPSMVRNDHSNNQDTNHVSYTKTCSYPNNHKYYPRIYASESCDF